MTCHRYQNLRFERRSAELIELINDIVGEYERDGLILTVRQLYYQLVARDVIPNTEKSYKSITSLVNKAKLAGYVDWEMFEDRTRHFRSPTTWDNVKDFMSQTREWYAEDLWDNQDCRIYCIVEKDALFGVLQGVCSRNQVPLLPARGYPSSTVIRAFCVDVLMSHPDQTAHILHLGDHDPSGIDMSRDLIDRIGLFTEGEVQVEFHRLALNYEQIEELKPPPNPAKTTDPRNKDYKRKFGVSSWELDAVEPRALEKLVQENITELRDGRVWNARFEEMQANKERLNEITEKYL